MSRELKQLPNILNYPKKISVVRHETCHQIYGYYTQQNKIKNPIILTLEEEMTVLQTFHLKKLGFLRSIKLMKQ